jgi:hypothetical protein
LSSSGAADFACAGTPNCNEYTRTGSARFLSSVGPRSLTARSSRDFCSDRQMAPGLVIPSNCAAMHRPSHALHSLPSGATFTPRVVGGGLAAAGFGLLGGATRCAESIDDAREGSSMNPGAVSLVFPTCVALAEAAGAVSARRAFPGTAARPGASATAARRLARPWASTGLAAAAGVFVACAGFVPSAD